MQANDYSRLSQSDEHNLNGNTVGVSDEDKKVPLKPYTYYDEGPFEAPSSESEEERLLAKDGPLQGGRSSPGTTEGGFAFREPKVRSQVSTHTLAPY